MANEEVAKDDPAALKAEALARAERVAEDDRRRFQLTLAMFANGETNSIADAVAAVRKLRSERRHDEDFGADGRLSLSKETLVEHMDRLKEANRFINQENDALKARVAELEAVRAAAEAAHAGWLKGDDVAGPMGAPRAELDRVAKGESQP